MNLDFEKYWKEEGKYLDYVTKNLAQEEEIKKFAKRIYEDNYPIVFKPQSKEINYSRFGLID